ncbi:MAG: hypothetical protein FWG83_08285 [Oscillospiraceae bacterium]|nr:hypothetical protein [Oscillospiraceae bacterium]
MPSNKNADLKASYFDLLLIKHENKNNTVIGLERAIIRQRSIMDEEDVAYVDKQIGEYLDHLGN